LNTQETKKETRGGTRLGSGAKPKYNEPTKTISFRVPISKIEAIKKMVTAELKNMTNIIDFAV
jgi:hypothetical protein